MTIAILYICTGRYNKFFEGFYDSCEMYFMNHSDKHYFVWTDDMELSAAKNVSLIYRKCQGFPADSLFRFEMFLKVRDELQQFDYIYFFNANTAFCCPIEEEILPNESGLVAAKWPGRDKQSPILYPYERNKKSLAYIAPFNPPYVYYMGGVNGGAAPAYLEMIDTCALNIRTDYENGIIAHVHDESHINKYLRSHACKVLTNEYCWPEEWKSSSFVPKIIFREKTAIDPYFNKGRDMSLWGKVKKASTLVYRTIQWYLQ